MKTLKTTITLLLLSLPFTNAFAQSPMLGKWTATCFFTRDADGSLLSCDLCPSKFINDNKNLKIDNFDCEFSESELTITQNDKPEKVKFVYNSKDEIVSFELKNNKYSFALIQSPDPNKKILKGKQGELIYLERK